MSEKAGKAWTREELILAINLYCKTPFGQIHVKNSKIIALADQLGRTPGSVSYKLANFACIDPSLPRKGASHISKLDRLTWAEFFESWEEMAFSSESLLAKTENKSLETQSSLFEKCAMKEGEDKETVVKTRVNQNFFRKMILAAYDNTCCLTGISIPELLIASHIVPWSIDRKNRLNPRNGLCLNALHDRAFDNGLMTIGDNWRAIVSSKISRTDSKKNNLDLIQKFHNKKILLPSRFLPDKSFLKYHRDNIFQN